jgi:hypothetical protein
MLTVWFAVASTFSAPPTVLKAGQLSVSIDVAATPPSYAIQINGDNWFESNGDSVSGKVTSAEVNPCV